MAISTKELRMLKASELLTHLTLLTSVFSLQLRTLVYHSNYEFIDTALSHFSWRTSILPTPLARLLRVAGKHCIQSPSYKRNMSHVSWYFPHIPKFFHTSQELFIQFLMRIDPNILLIFSFLNILLFLFKIQFIISSSYLHMHALLYACRCVCERVHECMAWIRSQRVPSSLHRCLVWERVSLGIRCCTYQANWSTIFWKFFFLICPSSSMKC